MAWLHAAPKANDKDTNTRSRLELLPDEHPAKVLPEIPEFFGMLFQLSGVCLTGAMSVTPLTWQEVQSFSLQSAYKLSGWQSEQLITMSRAYCNMSHKAKEKSCTAPYSESTLDELYDNEDRLEAMRDKVAKQFEGFASGLKKKPSK